MEAGAQASVLAFALVAKPSKQESSRHAHPPKRQHARLPLAAKLDDHLQAAQLLLVWLQGIEDAEVQFSSVCCAYANADDGSSRKRTTCIKGHTQHQAVQQGAKQPHLSRRASRAAGGGVHKVLLAQPLQRPWQLRYGHHAGLL